MKLQKGRIAYFKFKNEIYKGIITDFNETEIMFIEPFKKDEYVHTKRIFTHKISDESITWSLDRKELEK